MSDPILVIGAGGHARSCIDVIEREGRFVILGLVGREEELGVRVSGHEVIATDREIEALRDRSTFALVAIGQIKDPAPRIRAFTSLERSGYVLPVVVSPYAYVSPRATIGAGTIVMHGAIVNAGAIVGRNCILNSQSLVEHDAVIGDHCHVGTSATVNGGTRVGARTFLGSGSTIRDNLTVGEGTFIGMGQVVIRDSPAGSQLTGRADRQ